MLDEAILKSNFLGRDGFRWWIGQVPPIGSQKGQVNGEGWGNRLKVRILGYHPANPSELSNDDLPWAQVMLPTTSGSGAANLAVNPKIRPGDTVLGFFLDGDNGQIPIIIGCFGRTGEVPSTEYLAPFAPFTGYTNRITRPNGTLYPSEDSEDSTSSQKSPRRIPTDTTNKLNTKNENKDEISYSTAIGKKIVLGDSSSDNSAKGIDAEVYNLIQKVNDPYNKILNKVAEVSRSVDKIMGIAEGVIGQCTDSLYTGLIPILEGGLKALYNAVYAATLAATGNPVVAHAAGVAAQKAMVNPVKALQSFIPKIPGIVSNNLFGIVNSMLTDVVNNVKRPSSCLSTQFTASVFGEIIRKISGGLSGVLGGVSKILSAGFNVIDFLTSGVAAIRGISGLFDINQNKNKSFDNTDVWRIGIGPDKIADKLLDFKGILDNMNRANAARENLSDEIKSGISGVKEGFDIFSDLTKDPDSGCYTGPIISCSSLPKVKLFGGMGKDAAGEIVLGNFERDDQGVEISAGIIGIKVINKGQNYKYPPFVQIEDECERGYGAVARCNINEKGEVDNFYIVSSGENYPVGFININTSQFNADTDPSNLPTYVSDVFVQYPGIGYLPTDNAIDDFGNNYEVVVDDDGSIIDVRVTSSSDILSEELPIDPLNPIDPLTISSPTLILNNYIIVDELPVITIRTSTGSGAILRPVLERIPIELIQSDGKVDFQKLRNTKFVKDCIE